MWRVGTEHKANIANFVIEPNAIAIHPVLATLYINLRTNCILIVLVFLSYGNSKSIFFIWFHLNCVDFSIDTKYLISNYQYLFNEFILN